MTMPGHLPRGEQSLGRYPRPVSTSQTDGRSEPCRMWATGRLPA